MRISLFFLLFISNYWCLSANTKGKSYTIRVMTYNIRRKGKEKQPVNLWINRKPQVQAILDAYKPDIIGFQEVVEDQLDDLETMLPGYRWIGQGRGKSWGGLGGNEFTPLFYNSKKFELIEGATFPIVEWKWYAQKRTGSLPRIATRARLKNKRNGKEMYVYNTHLDNKYHTARLNGAAGIYDDMLQRTGGLPVILMGDFNTPFIPDMRQALPGFRASKKRAKNMQGDSYTRTGWNNEELKHIDHILVDDGVYDVLLYKVIESKQPYPSDHRPVVVDLIL